MTVKKKTRCCIQCNIEKLNNANNFYLDRLGRVKGNCRTCTATAIRARAERTKAGALSICHCCKKKYADGPDTRRYFCSTSCASDYKSDSSFMRFKGLIDLSK